MSFFDQILSELTCMVREDLEVELRPDENLFESSVDSFAMVGVMNIIERVGNKHRLEFRIEDVFSMEEVSLTVVANYLYRKSTLQKLLALMNELFKTAHVITEDTKINDFREWGSLKHVEFILLIEENFDLKVSPLDIHRLTQVSVLVDYILQGDDIESSC